MGGHPPGIVVGTAPHRFPIQYRQGRRSLWVTRREEQGRCAARLDREKCCTLRPDGVKNYPRVEGQVLGHHEAAWDRIGQSRASRVEEDQPRERRQPSEEPLERRMLPDHVEVPPAEVRHEHEIHRAVADNLVRDASFGSLGEGDGWRFHGHTTLAERTSESKISQESWSKSP